MNGVLVGLLAAFLQSCSYIFGGRYARETGKPSWTLLAPAFFLCGVAAFVALPLAMPGRAPDVSFPAPNWPQLLFAATLCVILCIGGNAATVAMLRHVDASRVSPLLALKVPLFAFAYALVGDVPTVPQWCAVAFVAASAALLAGAGRRIPAAGWGWLLSACALYCLSDRCIAWCLALSRDSFGGDLGRSSFFALCVVYACGGVVSAAALLVLGLPRPRVWLRHALPYGAAWLSAMAALFLCFAISGLVLGNIVQSTRGLVSVALGWLVARAGRTDMEEKVGAAILWRRVFAAVLVIAAMALYSLFPAASSAAGTTAATGRPPEPCLRRAEAAVASLDPAQAATVSASRAVALVYETPLQFSYSERPYRLGPYAAEAMPDISADGREITLRLRPDIWFDLPGGARRRATAADLVYSLKRLADAKLSSPGYWIVAGRVEGIDSFHEESRDLSRPTDYDADVPGLRALDDRTVRIRLVAPDAEFLWCLALPYASIVPREVVESAGDGFGGVDAGSGPFRLAHWRRGHRMLFVRREGRDPARDFAAEPGSVTLPPGARRFESVEYLQIADPSTRWLSFLGGALDYAAEISRDDWDAVISADGELSPELAARGVKMLAQPALDVSYIAFNMDDPVVGGANAALRRALSLAFDRDAWIALNRGRFAPADGPVPPGVAGRVAGSQFAAHDLAKAKRLLAEAGYPDGVDPATGHRLELALDIGRTDQEAREGAELVASFFAEIGVLLQPRYSAFPLFMQKLARRQSQMFMVSWLADYPDALNFLQLFVSSNASPGPNRSNYSNPEFDKWFAVARDTRDPEARATALAWMQRAVGEDCPWIFVAHRRETVLLRSTLGGFLLHDFPYGAEKHWFRLPADP